MYKVTRTLAGFLLGRDLRTDVVGDPTLSDILSSSFATSIPVSHLESEEPITTPCKGMRRIECVGTTEHERPLHHTQTNLLTFQMKESSDINCNQKTGCTTH